jgi:hypothetical protein
MLLEKISNLPRTERENDETDRNRFKENVAAIAKIDEQIERMLALNPQKDQIKTLEMQLNKESLSAVTLGFKYRQRIRLGKGSEFEKGFLKPHWIL